MTHATGKLGEALLQLRDPTAVAVFDLDESGRRGRKLLYDATINDRCVVLVTTTRRAEPRTFDSRPSDQASARFSCDHLGACQIARSSRIACIMTSKAGALTAHDEKRIPRIRFTTSVDNASPSTSSATMNKRLAGLRDLLEQREQPADCGVLTWP